MIKIVLTIFLLYWLAIVSCQNSIHRLPNTTYPIEYNIWLNLSLDSAGFNGKVEIKIGVNIVTNEIIVNSFDLDVKSVELFKMSGERSVKIPIVQHTEYIPYSLRWRLEYVDDTPVMLEIGQEYVLKLVYSGEFDGSTTGIYKSTFGHNKIIVTNFLPQYARRAFPCYDEPQFRTPFSISIMHPAKSRAISNMPIETKIVEESGLITTTFQTTPPLATHSIAFAITNYKSICTDNSVKICVFYDAQHIASDIGFLLQTAEIILNGIQKYFGDVLDIPKLDILPVYDEPNYIIGNYGLLINRESSYYWSSLTWDYEYKQRVIRHTIRQIVNIYFINYITPESWTDVWINDGISIYLEELLAEILFPEQDFKAVFIHSYCEIAGKNIVIKPSSGNLPYHDIVALFDKSRQYSSANLMIEFRNTVGTEIFFDGLRHLLARPGKSYSSETFFNTFESLAIANGPNLNASEFLSNMKQRLTEIRYSSADGFKDYNSCVLHLVDGNIKIIYELLFHLGHEFLQKKVKLLSEIEFKFYLKKRLKLIKKTVLADGIVDEQSKKVSKSTCWSDSLEDDFEDMDGLDHYGSIFEDDTDDEDYYY